jgi:hypothetical integral membrane protein (TIGR02206 family)
MKQRFRRCQLDRYFSNTNTYGPFELLSQSHITVIAIIIVTSILIYIFRNRLRCIDKNIRVFIALLLIVMQISVTLWYVCIAKVDIASALPLHLCDISTFLCAIMLINRNYFLYEITYFWGIAGAVQALLTPDLGRYAFPHFVFFVFFIVHGLIIIICLFLTFVDGYRPKLSSVFKSIGVLNIYAAFIAVFNIIFKTNYLFLREKPEGASLLDFLGPWPWYILSLEVIGTLLFLLCYVPFGIERFKNKYVKKRGIEL